MKLMERAPPRVVAAILSQPVGYKPDKPDFMYESGINVWAKEFLARRPDLVLPDDVVAPPLQVSLDIAAPAPNAEFTVFPRKEAPDLKARTINRARPFLRRHQTV